MKKTIAALLTAALITLCSVSLAGCDLFGKSTDPTTAPTTAAVTETPTAAPTEAPTKAPTEVPTEAPTEPPAPTTPPGPSPAYTAIRNCLSQSGAEGYTIARIIGSDSDQLILSFGVVEAEKHLDVYTIGDDGITYQGELSGSHTVPYIDSATDSFACFWAHMGSYSYGPATFEGGLRIAVEEEGTIEADEEYPDIPGSAIEFYHIDDLTPIENY